MKSILKFYVLTFFVLTAIIEGVSAQSPYKNVMISKDDSPNEVSIAFHPFDINNMVVGANIDSYYYTFDGGLTWSERKMTSSYGVWGDPCVVADTKGNFYFFHLSNSYEKGYYYDRLICQKSFDGGITWSDGSFMGANSPNLQDKEWAAVDLTYSPYRNNIYITWTQCGKNSEEYEYESHLNETYDKNENRPDKIAVGSPDDDSSVIFLSYSSDDGESWSERVRVSDVSGNVCSYPEQTVLGAAPCIGLNGEVYVAWSSVQGIILDKSTNGGASWLPNDITVTDFPGGFRFEVPEIYRCFSFPSLACDYSYSQNRGTIYINWADQRKGPDNTEIWLAKSTDEGMTWSSPIKVNDDTGDKHQFFTWMTVDQSTGYIYVVFYDRRNYDDNRTDVYMATSKDGGLTFVNERISEEPFTPLKSTFMGDYINIAANNGVIRPVWTRVDSTELSVYTAIINN